MLLIDQPITIKQRAQQPNGSLTIRPATQNDAAMLALMGRITFKDAFGQYFDPAVLERYLDDTFQAETISRQLTDVNTRYWIASVDEVPVAYAKVNLYSSWQEQSLREQAQLERIYVLRDFLNLGIGRQLLTTVQQQLRALHCDSLWLLVYYENDQAIRFYERHGFMQVAGARYAFGEQSFPFIYMEKRLNAGSNRSYLYP